MAVIEVFNRNFQRYFYVFIDKEDLERVKANGKNLSVGVSKCTNYCFIRINGKCTGLHRFLMNTPEGLVVDHLNHNGLDNRKRNLRNCTQSENTLNFRKKGFNNPLYGLWAKYREPQLLPLRRGE